MKIDRRSRFSLNLGSGMAWLPPLSVVFFVIILMWSPRVGIAEATSGPTVAGMAVIPVRWEHAMQILNPWYIRITTAVITHNQKDLAQYAAKMKALADSKTRAFLWFPATRARTLCLAYLDHQDKFAKSFAALCCAKGA
ncbi:MAG: hypothetical protein ACP5O7_11625 [Phycisphaerae bacterium]